MEDIKFRTKLAQIEADLVSASALGEAHLHAEVCTKLAELIENEDDLQLVLDRLADYDAVKTAGIGAKALPALSLAALAAGPAMAGAKWLSNRRAKDRAWSMMQSDPDVIGEDPVRAKAMFDLLHSTSPHLATNPVVARDLMKQMGAMPMVDLGTASALARTGKDISSVSGGGGLDAVLDSSLRGHDAASRVGKNVQALTSKAASLMGTNTGVPVRWTSPDGVPCAFDWSTPAMKEAGVTDAFLGHGDNMRQADNAYNVKMMQDGLSLLPLDAVVRELLTKEQELAQREDVLMQQEMQVQQAMQQMQQMQQAYSQQYGVDPQAQQPMAPEAADQGFAPEGGGMPPIDEAPAEDPAMGEPAMDEPPMDAGGAMGEDQMDTENPVPNDGGETAMEAGGQEPPVEGEDPTGGADPATTDGFDDEAGMGEATMVSDESALEGEDEYDETVPGDLDGDGEDDLNGDGELDEEALPPGMGGDIDGDGEDDGNQDGEVDEAGLAEEAAEEASEAVSPEGASVGGEEGDVPAEGEEMAPEGGDLEGADIEGTVQDELDHHQGPDALSEGSPEDMAADEALADEMSDTGEEPMPIPGGAPHEMVGAMDGGPAPEEMAGDPLLGAPPAPAPAPATPQPQIGPDGSMNITVPLPAIQVSIKMAEKCAEERMAEDRGEYYQTLNDLFRPE